MKNLFLILINILNIHSINVSIPSIRENKLDISVSVIIPCYHKHFHFLQNLLEEYSKQTELPNQIVISISEAKKIPASEITKLKNSKWPFEVKILVTNRQLFAGQNRNKAAANASYEILVCQDADDIPHPQRIELIKYAFNNYQIDFLMHLHSYEENILNFIYQIEQDPLSNLKLFKLENDQFDGESHGTTALTKNVFNEFKWPNNPFSQDRIYNHNLFKNGYTKHVLQIPLNFYRKQYSSADYKKTIIKLKRYYKIKK
jgi:hypothetical protein